MRLLYEKKHEIIIETYIMIRDLIILRLWFEIQMMSILLDNLDSIMQHCPNIIENNMQA